MSVWGSYLPVRHGRVFDYLLAIALPTASFALTFLLEGQSHNVPLLSLYVLSTIVSSLVGGLFPGLLSSLLSILYSLLIVSTQVPPGTPMVVSSRTRWVFFLLYCVVSVVSAVLISELRDKNVALRGSEERFSKIFDKAAYATMLLRLPKGEIANVNPEWTTLFGYSKEEAIGKTGLDLKIFPDAETRMRLKSEFDTQGSLRNYEIRLCTKSGLWRLLSGNWDQLEMAGEQFVLASFQDITERRQVEEALRDSEQQFRLLFHTSPVAMQVITPVDDEGGHPNGFRFLDVNPALERLVGKPASHFIGRTIWEAWPNASPESAERQCRVALTGVPDHFEGFSEVINKYWEATCYSPRQGVAVTCLADITDRKQAEAALRASEANYRSIVESASDGIFIVDGMGRYLDGNLLGCQMLGYTREELLVRTLADIVVAEEEVRLAPELAKLKVGDIVHSEWLYRRKDGSTFRGEVSGTILPDGRNIGILRDITDRRAAEAALRESEEKFRTLADLVPQMVWMCTPDGLNIYFNQRWVDYTGMSLEESYGRGWNTPFHDEDKQKAWDAWNRAVATGEPYQVESRLRAAEGSYRWFLMQGVPMRDPSNEVVKWFGTCTDIEDMKRAEEALRRSEAQFRTLANAIPQLAWIANPDGWIYWYNEGWYKYTGTTPQQMEGWGWQSVHDRVELPLVMERWQASISTGNPFEMTFPLRGANGEFRSFLTRVSPIKDESGKVLRWFGTNTDIEEQKLTEEKLRSHAEQLRALLARMQQVREEERANVARDLHDDVGQIMTAVKMDVSWIASHAQKNPDAIQKRVAGTLELINNGVKSVRKMCTELRPGILDDLGLVAALEWQATEFSNRSGIFCELTAVGGELAVDKDTSTAVFRIFQEALTNVARHAQASLVVAKIEADEKQLRLTVRDDGVGIAEKDHEGRFGILGMRERAAVLGGTVGITAPPGGGTIVAVVLPKIQNDTP